YDEYARLANYLRCSFSHDTATTEIYTLSLHDALPIFTKAGVKYSTLWSDDFTDDYFTARLKDFLTKGSCTHDTSHAVPMSKVKLDRKSTRLNFSHVKISYAVFCLKKKIINKEH